ncbi:MAG: glutaredoxin family protein [Thermoplasmatota archaeon]
MTEITKVEGENDKNEVFLYAISTCGWCKKVKKLLKEMDIEYEYIDIDTVSGSNSKEIREELKEYNPSGSCPTLVINDGGDVIIGYQKDKIKEVLEDEG